MPSWPSSSCPPVSATYNVQTSPVRLCWYRRIPLHPFYKCRTSSWSPTAVDHLFCVVRLIMLPFKILPCLLLIASVLGLPTSRNIDIQRHQQSLALNDRPRPSPSSLQYPSSNSVGLQLTRSATSSVASGDETGQFWLPLGERIYIREYLA